MTIEAVATEVAEARDTMARAARTLGDLAAQIRRDIDNREALVALAASLDAGSNELEAAISSVTPPTT